MDASGTLEVVLARGVMTAYEAVALEPGHLVSFGDRECGDPVSLYFNSHHMGRGEVVVVDDVVTVVVTSMSWSPPPIGSVGEADDVVELLETRLVLARAEVPLRELRGVGELSVLVFDKRLDRDGAVELTANDMPLAVGEAYFRTRSPLWSERTTWSMRVAEVKATMSELELPVQTSAWVDRITSDRLKHFDFRRPDRMSKEEVRNMSLLHERFADNLNLASQLPGQLMVAWVDQLAHSQLMEQLPPDTTHVTLEMPTTTDADDPKQRYAVEVGQPGVLDGEKMAELATDAARNAKAPAFSRVHLAYRAGGLVAELRNKLGMPTLLQLLRNAWKQRILMDIPEARDMPEGPWANSIPAHDMLITVGLRATEEEVDDLVIVYPYVHLRKVISLLG